MKEARWGERDEAERDRAGGRIDDLPPFEATLIFCLRWLHEGDKARAALERSVLEHLGSESGAALMHRFSELWIMSRRVV